MGGHAPGVCGKCGGATGSRQATICSACYRMRGSAPRPHVPPVTQVTDDLAALAAKRQQADLKTRYGEALKRIEELERRLEADRALDAIDTHAIEPTKERNTSEATAVWVASDWHIEERVGAEVGTLNRYSLDIAKARADAFFRNGLRLTHILGQDVAIANVVLALLGDFITNDIHDELVELNALSPVEALATVQGWLASGIEHVLAQSAYTLTIPCHSGNHGRTTKTTRFGTEAGHSLEHLMYLHLAAYFRHEPRVKFLIPDGMHSYLTVYDQVIRFQHGHAIKYAGGVGGIYVPVNKAIAQWNRGKRADLDVFGHFHQFRDGGSFICNGSMIGYNSFALSIKADYEKPRQAFFLMDKKRGKTFTAPILFDK